MLGKGSFGVVYKGINKKNSEQQLAIKCVDKLRLNPWEVNEIDEEIFLLQKCDHPNIVNYYETYDDNQYIYLCMELCTGGELMDQLVNSKKKFTEAEAAKVFAELLVALHHLHSQEIIHRDIKPENLMFQKPGGIIKFIDFGLAVQMRNVVGDEIAGTPYYIAPEVIKGKYSPACDIWSLGVVLYQVLSGELPFKGRNKNRLFENIQNTELRVPEHFSK